ncbi:hypothetical protein BTA51_11330 [Hahella sp. CCB-MM4]|uniref:hypothetical protein n=1 Tax=Hahella sp. (strain CCB-MM4) TaxID=1926491 RepID=UPI000B9B6BF8|nr:hypothetical protein [Hahella sp. CCB-MM4]OZG73082.1 hypothetical protein BTA51_11330 [Hahella sp. CCB-MM4]
MTKPKGAMTLAEGRYDYRVDVSLILNNGKDKKDFVLRTCLDNYDVWKAKYGKSCSPFSAFISGTIKRAAIIDYEVWVFGVNGTVASDIVVAVKIGMNYFKVSAEDILCDVYVKNLNVEGEDKMGFQHLVDENRKLYSGVCESIMKAANVLGCSNALNFWVFSNIKNHKIPKSDLHASLRDGGAHSVTTDEKTRHVFRVGDNFGGQGDRFKTHLHLAVLKP